MVHDAIDAKIKVSLIELEHLPQDGFQFIQVGGHACSSNEIVTVWLLFVGIRYGLPNQLKLKTHGIWLGLTEKEKITCAGITPEHPGKRPVRCGFPSGKCHDPCCL